MDEELIIIIILMQMMLWTVGTYHVLKRRNGRRLVFFY